MPSWLLTVHRAFLFLAAIKLITTLELPPGSPCPARGVPVCKGIKSIALPAASSAGNSGQAVYGGGNKAPLVLMCHGQA